MNVKNIPPKRTIREKAWRLWHFQKIKNCWEASIDQPVVRDYLKDTFTVFEVGCGTADLSIELAVQNPLKHYIALDVKAERLYQGAKRSEDLKLPNIRFLRAHANSVLDIVGVGSVDELWLTFPDPFPKKSSAKHRLTHQSFLSIYKTLLKEDGSLYFKTDNKDLFCWSLEQLEATGWIIKDISFDLHSTDMNYPTTVYERRYIVNDVPIYFLSCKLSV